MHRTPRAVMASLVLVVAGLLGIAAAAPAAAAPAPVVVGQVPTAMLDAFERYNAEQAWYFGIEAQRQIDAAAAAARARSSSGPRGGTVGECTGFAIPDYIIQRESGGNPSAVGPDQGNGDHPYGCGQTLLSHYSGGSCGGLDPYTIDGQRECVNRLSSGGSNLGPWAATR